MTVTFDRRLAPSTVNGNAIALRSAAVGVFTGFRYDVVRRRVELMPDARALRPTLQYDLIVTGAVRAWDGAPLANPITFRVRPGAVEPARAPAVPSLTREVAPLLADRCARASCHGGDAPAMGLDLSSPERIRATTVRVASRERPATSPDPVTPSDPAWGAMLRVDPGNAVGVGRPEYSYLVYKVLGDGPVVGARMPPEGPALTEPECALIADWIAAGAPAN